MVFWWRDDPSKISHCDWIMTSGSVMIQSHNGRNGQRWTNMINSQDDMHMEEEISKLEDQHLVYVQRKDRQQKTNMTKVVSQHKTRGGDLFD